MHSLSSRSQGVIFIEILLSSIVGILLIAVVFQIYQSSQRCFQLQQSLSDIEDSAQNALDILSKEIKLAGYIGCGKLTIDFPIVGDQHYSITPFNKLTGTDSTLIVRHASTHAVELLYAMREANHLEVSNKIAFKPKSILMISDCKHAEIFEVERISHAHGAQIITPKQPLHRLFDQHAEVSRFEINRFFIEKSGLYMENIHRTKMRLVDGVESLYITYHPIEIDLTLNKSRLRKVWHAYVAT